MEKQWTTKKTRKRKRDVNALEYLVLHNVSGDTSRFQHTIKELFYDCDRQDKIVIRDARDSILAVY